MREEDVNAILENAKECLKHLMYYAERNVNKLDIDSGICDLTIEGVEYQMQLCLKTNKDTWTNEEGARFSIVDKITFDKYD